VLPQIKDEPIVCNDCPASLLPNGKVLVTGAPFVFNGWGSPIYFFEYDPYTSTITQAPTPPNNGARLYWSRMMLLPTGQVLFGPSAFDLQVYTPDGGPQEAWRPTVREITGHCAGAAVDYYLLRGEQLNGLSQANMYGDDCSPATNYPLVRLRRATTGEVFYCRTHDFSTMAVATGTSLESVRFDAGSVPYGDYELCVVANGISSHCVSFCHRRPALGSGGCGCGGCDGGCGHESDRCCQEAPTDPQIGRLRAELSALRTSVGRYATPASGREPARAPKETRAGDDDDDLAAEREAADE